jgi:predicted transcriptional regulator
MTTDERTAATQHHPFEGLTVREFCSVGFVEVPPEAPVVEVARLMAGRAIHAVLVVDEQGPPEVLSDADLISAVASGRMDQLCAREVAGTYAIGVRRDESLDDAVRLLAEHDVTHLIVTDATGGPIGVLSALDVARALSLESRRRAEVGS